MKGLFTHHKWKGFEITVFCSNEHCNRTITLDKRQLEGIVFCGKKCLDMHLKNDEQCASPIKTFIKNKGDI